MREWKAAGSFGTLGLEIVLSIMFGLFAGRWLDDRFETRPTLAVIGFVFGVAAAVKAVVRTWRQMQAVTREEEREEGNPAPLFETPGERERREREERAAREYRDGDGADPGAGDLYEASSEEKGSREPARGAGRRTHDGGGKDEPS
jgi:hypothetical protein